MSATNLPAKDKQEKPTISSLIKEVKGRKSLSNDLNKAIRYIALNVAVAYEKNLDQSLPGPLDIELPERADEVLDSLFLIKDLVDNQE